MPRMTSTKTMTGTGFMKCMPMKRSARPVAPASRVIEIEEVLDARIVRSGQIESSLRNRSLFAASSSTTASTTTSASAKPERTGEVVIRARAADFSCAVRLPRAISRSRFFSIDPRAFSR